MPPVTDDPFVDRPGLTARIPITLLGRALLVAVSTADLMINGRARMGGLARRAIGWHVPDGSSPPLGAPWTDAERGGATPPGWVTIPPRVG
jgi:hypothetical protein